MTADARNDDDGPGVVAQTLLEIPVDMAQRGGSVRILSSRTAQDAVSAPAHADGVNTKAGSDSAPADIDVDAGDAASGLAESAGLGVDDVASAVGDVASVVGDIASSVVDALPGPSDLL
ncbi:hypothetical protein FB451DRAFT_1417515 [Mycena latifolia]|nr:hypothetical protein FB451DRAFT_1417515 [Mycena latifolia]